MQYLKDVFTRRDNKKDNKEDSLLSSRLGVLSAKIYMKLCSNHASSFRGDIVLSSIIVEHVSSSKLAVVAFAVGTKYLSSSVAKSDQGRGEIVRDSHAEVLARRAFGLFLYSQIASTKQGNTTLFRRVGKDSSFEFRDDEYRFHLYISTAPCGACSIKTKDDRVLAKSFDHATKAAGKKSLSLSSSLSPPAPPGAPDMV